MNGFTEAVERHQGFDVDGELLECLDENINCDGVIEYRTPLSSTGRSFPRCDFHWNARLEVQEVLNRRYPTHAPRDFSEADAGEHWDEDY
jgi:hypothetical protein